MINIVIIAAPSGFVKLLPGLEFDAWSDRDGD
jgi:hypothetical protein